MDDTEGKFAVKLARRALEDEIDEKDTECSKAPEIFLHKRGAFVTINTHPYNELRGCIGYAEAVYPLLQTIIYAARYACHDPRFPDLIKEELDRITVEVSVLTTPERLGVEAAERPEHIQIGRDGIIIECGDYKGLLLPQVAAEWEWDSREFLAHACVKAGLDDSAWEDGDVDVFKFQAEIFHELSPNGEIERYEE